MKIARRLAGVGGGALVVLGVLAARGHEVAWADEDSFSGLTSSLTAVTVDDFNGPEGQLPSPALWNFETGAGGWGNGEQQRYTDDPRNVRLDGVGDLVIEAREDNGEPTSARITTKGKAELTNGVAAARIKLPQGQGLHPAFWMLGTSLDAVGYPKSGEIDVVEIVNDASRAYFSLHGPNDDGSKWKLSEGVTLPDLSQGYHTYWVAKQPDRIVVGIDEAALATFRASDLPPGAQWVQNAPFFALLNLAVAGEWPGPLGPGVLPAQMSVDWFRLYQ